MICSALLLQEGTIPVPIFINGVEAHTVVRDLLTTDHEQGKLARGEVRAFVDAMERANNVMSLVFTSTDWLPHGERGGDRKCS